MRKYISLLSIGAKDALTNRGELLLWSLIDAMPLIAMLVLWISAYGDKTEIAGYTKTALVSYYLIGYIFQDLTGAYFEESMLNQIRQGTIVSALIKPISLKIGVVIREIGWRIATLISSVIPIIILSIFFAKDVITRIDMNYLALIPLFIILAYLMESVYSLMVVALGFTFEEAYSLSHLKWMLGWLFSGSMMPFEFMPEWLAKLAMILPFQFRYYVPVNIIQGQLSVTAVLLKFTFGLGWLLVLILLLDILWKFNIKRFTAVGN